MGWSVPPVPEVPPTQPTTESPWGNSPRYGSSTMDLETWGAGRVTGEEPGHRTHKNPLGPMGFGWKHPPGRWSESCFVLARWWLMVIFWTCAKQICEDILIKFGARFDFDLFLWNMEHYGTENHALNCDVKRPGCAFQPPKVTSILGGESFWKQSYWLDERWGGGSICGWWTSPKNDANPPRNKALFRAHWPLDHWFPLMRPAIKPLFLKGDTDGEVAWPAIIINGQSNVWSYRSHDFWLSKKNILNASKVAVKISEIPLFKIPLSKLNIQFGVFFCILWEELSLRISIFLPFPTQFIRNKNKRHTNLTHKPARCRSSFGNSHPMKLGNELTFGSSGIIINPVPKDPETNILLMVQKSGEHYMGCIKPCK